MAFKRFALALLLLLLITFPQKTLAQMIPLESITPSPTPTKIDYTLPYPGLLPGSPVYAVKLFRDKILEIFTLNPLKKTEFYLLQADKRLSAATILFDQKNEEEAETTLSKSQNYLEKAIDGELSAKKISPNVMEICDKIEQSSKKQVEIISSLLKNSKGQIHQKLAKDLERAKSLEKRAEDFES